MSGRFVRASSFRHVHGEPAKDEGQFKDTKAEFKGTGHFISGNGKYMAFAGKGGGGPVNVLRLDQPGRQANAKTLTVHKNAVLDFKFSPFYDDMLATTSEDGYIKLTDLGPEGLTADRVDATASLEGHQKKVHLFQWHPTASNIGASASFDNTVQLWDCGRQKSAHSVEFPDVPYDIQWNANGSLLAVTCKDTLMRVADPRTAGEGIKGQGFEGNKQTECQWIDNHGWVLATGFSKSSMRQYALFDPKKMDKAFVMADIDQSAGVLMPFYDADTGVLFIAGHGDAGISYYEITADAPHVHFLAQYRDKTPQKGLTFLPKRFCDTAKCEIGLALRLMKDSVIPISFQVPRKSDMFQSDLFPDTYAGVPSNTAEEYLKGVNKEPTLKSMKPGAEGPKAAAPAAAPAIVDWKARAEAAEREVAALKAELAKLKA